MKMPYRISCFLFFLCWMFCLHATSTPIEPTGKILYSFSLEEEIGPASQRCVNKAFKEAKAINADLILLELNTFGGALNNADAIRTQIMQSEIPTWVFININAASAGALIAIACDSIYMHPAASIGAAAVVDANGNILPDKYQSYMRSMMRATAETQGRDPQIAEAMVDPDLSIPHLSDSGKILTFTAQEAVQNHYCQGIYNSMEELKTQLLPAVIEEKRMETTIFDRIINFLIHPAVSGILIMFIIGGIYFELQSPGIGFALAVAVTAALLYFAPLYIEGLANHWEILIFLAGIVLLLLEFFVIPGFGIAGISGIICLLAGLILSMVNNSGFNFNFVSYSNIGTALITVLSGFFASIVLGYYLCKHLFSSKKVLGTHWALETEQKKEAGYIAVDLDNSLSLIGKTAFSESSLRPGGEISIEGIFYDAIAEYGMIEKHRTVKIVGFNNAQFVVREVEN